MLAEGRFVPGSFDRGEVRCVCPGGWELGESIWEERVKVEVNPSSQNPAGSTRGRGLHNFSEMLGDEGGGWAIWHPKHKIRG